MRWISTKNGPAICLLGLVAVIMLSRPLAAEEPPLRELLDSIKPEGVPNAHVAPSTYSTPTPVRSAPPSGLVARYPTASELWSVPMPQAARQSKAFDPQLWAPDPNASAAYRRVAGSAPAISTTDALRQVRYPQRTATKPTEIRHHRPVDWQSTSAPSSASYFDALQRAKRNAAAAKTETRVGRAQAHVKYGFDLARRGAAHSAEQEFTEALWAVAHANDARAGNRQHADALRQGLLALEEAEEFSPLVRSQDSCVEASRIAARHKSTVARRVVKQQLDAVSAMQVYLDHAQRALALSLAGDGAGAEALYGLSRSVQVKSQNGSCGSGLAGAKAMALLLAAHDVQPGDHKITNELGVLYARFGELNKAELMLKRSLIAREHAESWHNLSRVWEMAGKDELSHYASQRSGQLKQVGATSRPTSVRFVEPQVFAASAPGAPGYSLPPSATVKSQIATTGTAPSDAKAPNWFQRVLAHGPLNVAKSNDTTQR